MGWLFLFFCMLQLPIKRKSDSLLVIIQNSRCNQIEFLDDYIGGDSPPNYIKNHVRQSSIIFLNFRGGRDGERITTLRKTSSRNNNTNTFLRWHLNPPWPAAILKNSQNLLWGADREEVSPNIKRWCLVNLPPEGQWNWTTSMYWQQFCQDMLEVQFSPSHKNAKNNLAERSVIMWWSVWLDCPPFQRNHGNQFALK